LLRFDKSHGLDHGVEQGGEWQIDFLPPADQTLGAHATVSTVSDAIHPHFFKNGA
jgi:hypothetical protein